MKRSTFKRRLTALVVVAPMAFTLWAGTGGTASAAFSDCPAGRACLFGNNDYVWLIATKGNNRGFTTLTGDANNQNDSYANRSVSNAAGFDTAQGTGDCLDMPAGAKDNDLAWFNSNFISTWRTSGGC